MTVAILRGSRPSYALDNATNLLSGAATARTRLAKGPEMTRLEKALTLVDEWVGPQGPSGVGAAIWRHGQIVAEHYSGMATPSRVVDVQTLFPLASVTKPIAAAAIMTLLDAGQLSLDEPVSRLVPEFRAGPTASEDEIDPELERYRHTIGVRHLLSHVSGLPEDLGPRDSRYRETVGLDVVIDQMLRLPLKSAPGKELRYSNAGFGVLARVGEVVSERPFWDLAEDKMLRPLGLEDIVANPSGSVVERVALLADTTNPDSELESYNGAYWRSLALPWGGLFGSPRDVVRFAASFLPSGEQVLSEASVREMIRDQTNGVPGGVESAKVRWDAGRWGLGWEVKGDKRRHWTGDLTSPATFCHFGHAGTLLWGDPERDLALAVFVNRAVTHMWGFILTRWARLSNAVVAAVTP